MEWETIGRLGLDAATCGFGDAGILGEQFRLKDESPGMDGSGIETFTEAGLPLVCLVTREDFDLPVEVERDPDGNILAARLCFTDDVDTL